MTSVELVLIGPAVDSSEIVLEFKGVDHENIVGSEFKIELCKR